MLIWLTTSVTDTNIEISLAQIGEICGYDIAEKIIESSKNFKRQEISGFGIQCLKKLRKKTIKMFEFRTDIFKVI